MKSGLLMIAALIGVGFGFFFAQVSSDHGESGRLIYSHDENGAALGGSKAALADAVRAGKPVRVYWSGRYVEHATDSFFLTIIGGEVFAQIESIRAQRPVEEPPSIELMDEEQRWAAIFATNGDRALKWFVQN
jgi:hypothetical protein